MKTHVQQHTFKADRSWKRNKRKRDIAGHPHFFELPITYNKKVQKWIRFFQSRGKNWFQKRLFISHQLLPELQRTMRVHGLPEDLAYIAMIESGFSVHAKSSAKALGAWQFMRATANRYGLKTTWWLDERKNLKKSTKAAASYLEDLYRMFGDWHLTAAAYNMGESRLKGLIRRHKTKNFWALSRGRGFPQETRDYIPKLIAAVIISKSPKLYGFSTQKIGHRKYYSSFPIPGGIDLVNMARSMGMKKNALITLNPELTKGFVPKWIREHPIRIPRGSLSRVSQYVRKQKRLR